MCTPVKGNTISIQYNQEEDADPEDNASLNEYLFAEVEGSNWKPDDNMEGKMQTQDLSGVASNNKKRLFKIYLQKLLKALL